MHVARVALRVSDAERSADFYSRVTGLAVREGDADAASLGAPDGGPVRLELRRAARPGAAPTRAAGLFHTAFRYPGRAGLGAALRRLAEGRQPLTGASDHLVSEALYLDDPDGLGIELYGDRPRSEWPPPAPGERVRMDTLPLDLDPILAAATTGGGADGIEIGHVHLKVADVERSVRFWTEAIGLELMTRFGADAAFLADGGYHHHVGVNAWFSRGAELEPPDAAGLDQVVVGVDDPDSLQRLRGRLEAAAAPVGGSDGRIETSTPDGVPVAIEVDASVRPRP
jgi:catechol 2,3-dioxygenase